MKTIHWFREDLRLLDNPALHFAAAQGSVTPVYIFPEGLGSASYWWLHYSLERLSNSLKEKGVSLVLRSGDPSKILPELAADVGANQVVWNRVYSPKGMAEGEAMKAQLEANGLTCKSFNGQLLIEPTNVLNKQGTPFKVFTPFWRHCLNSLSPPEPLPEPDFVDSQSQRHDSRQVESQKLEDWGLLPTKPNWAKGFEGQWQPGELGAQVSWRAFLDGAATRYKDGRDIPSESNTSLLSPHLAFGEISPRQLWHDMHNAIACQSVDSENGAKYLSEIGWREFSRYLLVHFPYVESKPFNSRFELFPWQDNPALIDAWKHGKTGYPIVDAGMRELWHTGYMHNRVRMIVASFLTKHCLSHWEHGMQWFWDTLLDADIANNTASWQWAAGCGADASPYFRIFNPILQGEKFDADGAYIKKWLPELKDLPKKYINKPWEADGMTLTLAKVTLGVEYPYPIVEHKAAREAALSAYQAIKK